MGVVSRLWHRFPARFLLLVVAIAVVGTGIACGEPDSAFDNNPRGQADESPDGTPSPPRDDASEGTITPSSGIFVAVTEVGAPISPIYLVEYSHLIITGTVVEMLPAQWTTPDGNAPPDPESALDRFDATIITPVVIELDGPPIVSRVSETLPINLVTERIVVAALGGQIGTHFVETNTPASRFTIGSHVMVMLRANNPFGVNTLVPTEAGLAWAVWHQYVLTPDGTALSYGGEVSEPTDELIARIRVAAEQLPAVHPDPPVVPTVSEQ